MIMIWRILFLRISVCVLFTLTFTHSETVFSEDSVNHEYLQSNQACCELNQQEPNIDHSLEIYLLQLESAGVGQPVLLSQLITQPCTVISTGMRACPNFLGLNSDKEGYQQLELLREKNTNLAYFHVYTAEPHPTLPCNASAGGEPDPLTPVSIPAHCTNNDRALNAKYVREVMLKTYSRNEILIDPIQSNPFMNRWGGATSSPTAVSLVVNNNNINEVVYSSTKLDTAQLQDNINEYCNRDNTN